MEEGREEAGESVSEKREEVGGVGVVELEGFCIRRNCIPQRLIYFQDKQGLERKRGMN